MFAPSAIRSSRVVSVTFRQAVVSKSSTSVTPRSKTRYGKAEHFALLYLLYWRKWNVLNIDYVVFSCES
jgi:hypothetical protein